MLKACCCKLLTLVFVSIVTKKYSAAASTKPTGKTRHPPKIAAVAQTRLLRLPVTVDGMGAAYHAEASGRSVFLSNS